MCKCQCINTRNMKNQGNVIALKINHLTLMGSMGMNW